MQYRRNFQPGGTYFFTHVTEHRRPTFADERAVALLRNVVNEEKAARPFRMEAWVVMPDHLHMIWTLPPGDSNYSIRWAAIKGNFTRRWLQAGGSEVFVGVSKQRDRKRGVWQRRFFEHTVRDDDDFVALVEYIHFNPVKHSVAQCPADYLHSSFAEYVRRGTYPGNWCCAGKSNEREPTPMADYEGME